MKKNYYNSMLLGVFALCSTLVACNSQSATNNATESVTNKKVNTPTEAIEMLIKGNERYMTGQSIYPHANQSRRTETVPHQAPFASVIACSDSRVPVELLFDQGIGDIFVIRTAGNNVNGNLVMGSIDYAVEHLGVKTLLVLGHSSCGGVTGAVSNESEHGAIGALLDTIRKDIPEYVGKIDSLNNAIDKHTNIQVERILSFPHIAEKVQNGELIVKAAHYDIKTGKVTIK